MPTHHLIKYLDCFKELIDYINEFEKIIIYLIQYQDLRFFNYFQEIVDNSFLEIDKSNEFINIIFNSEYTKDESKINLKIKEEMIELVNCYKEKIEKIQLLISIFKDYYTCKFKCRVSMDKLKITMSDKLIDVSNSYPFKFNEKCNCCNDF